jgi:hypothetical protein
MTRAEWIEALDRTGADAARYRWLKANPNEAFKIFREAYLLEIDMARLDKVIDDARNKS